VDGIRFIEKIQANPVDKDRLAAEMEPLYKLFSKSLVVQCDLPVGTILEKRHLTIKKPGSGIAANRLDEFVGRRVRRQLVKDQLIDEDDFD